MPSNIRQFFQFLLALELFQEIARYLLDLLLLFRGQFQGWAGEDVKDSELLFGQFLGDGALFLFVEPLGKLDQLVKEILDYPEVSVIHTEELEGIDPGDRKNPLLFVTFQRLPLLTQNSWLDCKKPRVINSFAYN